MSESRRSTSNPTRRRFLAGAAAFLPAAYLYGCAGGGSRSGLFTLGVASGEPRPDSVVLWTRLAPDPLAGGGMASAPVEIAWTVASDEAFTRIVRRGTAMAVPKDAHSVHIEVAGLEPGRTYWYRFIARGEASPTGRTRTAPAAGDTVNRLRFAYASCQQYEQGYYAAHRHMAADDLNVVFFLGDYIYEASWGKNLIRHHGSGKAMTLADYRNRYALYKRDPDLQASHAAFPWIVTWDDHEVSNNYADDAGEHFIGPPFRARRAAAYKAYWEHMPLSPSMRPIGPHAQIYRAFDFGTLARFAIIDDRQYRSHEACQKPGFVGGGGTFLEKSCPRRLDPHRIMLGGAQERWLQQTIDRSKAHWTVLAQQTRMAQFEVLSGGERSVSLDGWDGYPVARQRLLGFIGARKPPNPLVIGGDVHATYIGNLKPDFDDPASPVVATELCGTSITSYGPANRKAMARHIRQNPHMLYGNGWTRGYMRMTLDRRQAVAELRGLADAQDRDSAISTVAKFAVESGRHGVTPA